jgi:Flp pilus assembly protein TadD
MAVYEAIFGRFDEALRFAERAVELDPLDPMTHMESGRVLMCSGRPAEAEANHRRALELSPGMVGARSTLGLLLLLQGRGEEALDEVRKEESPGYRNFGLAIAAHALGRSEESDRALAALMAIGEEWAAQIAMVHAERGEADDAFRWLERAVELRDSGVVFTAVIPWYRRVHGDPRWKPLLERLGLAG